MQQFSQTRPLRFAALLASTILLPAALSAATEEKPTIDVDAIVKSIAAPIVAEPSVKRAPTSVPGTTPELAVPKAPTGNTKTITAPSAKTLQEVQRLLNILHGGNVVEFHEAVRVTAKDASSEMLYQLGEIYDKTLPSHQMLSDERYKIATDFYQRAMVQNASTDEQRHWKYTSQTALAVLLAEGKGRPRDIDQAEALVNAAIKLGNVQAMYAYAKMLADGKLGTAPNPNKAAYWYSAAAHNDVGEAALALSKLYSDGLVVAPSKGSAKAMAEIAVTVFIKQATRGDVNAEYRLGTIYSSREFSQKNIPLAIEWLEKAISHGHVDAKAVAGELYAKQKQLGPDAERGTRYILEAAQGGSEAAAKIIVDSLFQGTNYPFTIAQDVAVKWLKKMVVRGNDEAVTLLAKWYINQERVAEAVPYLKQAANAKNGMACFKLYTIYANKSFSLFDETLAKNYFTKATTLVSPVDMKLRLEIAQSQRKANALVYNVTKAENQLKALGREGSLAAMNELGDGYENGGFGEIKLEDSFYWRNRAAQLGDATATLALSRMYDQALGTKEDKKKGRELLQKAMRRMDKGQVKTMARLGRAYKEGKGVVQDKQKAFEWFWRAAQGGHATSKMEVARMIRLGVVDDHKPEEAIAMFREAAEAGSAAAWLELGKAYASGNLVALNTKRAIYHYEQAWDAGSTSGARLAGLAYLAGMGVLQNSEKGIGLLQSASNGGNAEAMMDLANYYLSKGAGSRALPLLKTATLKGHPEASYHLGQAYLKGTMVAKNQATGMKYINKSAELEFYPAQVMARAYQKKQEKPVPSEAVTAITPTATPSNVETAPTTEATSKTTTVVDAPAAEVAIPAPKTSVETLAEAPKEEAAKPAQVAPAAKVEKTE